MLSARSIIIRSYFISFILIITTSVFAQENSPYSRYGLGDVYPAQHIATRSLGGITAAYSDGQTINVYNPATYSNIPYYINGGLVTYDIGISIDARTLRSANTINKYNSTNFIPSYVLLGVPVSKKHLGLVFGLKPLTRINYSIDEKVKKIFETGFYDSLQTLYEGSGGLNEAFVGVGKRWRNLSLGFNAGYNFGKRETSTKINFINDTVAYNQSNTTATANFHGVVFNGGLQYDIKLNEQTDSITKTRSLYGLRLGVDGSWHQKLNASSENLTETFVYNQDGGVVPVDTVSYKQNASGTIQLPSYYSAGFMFTKTVSSSIISVYKWMFGAEYSTGNWAKDYRFYGQPDKVINSWMLRVGGQFAPAPLTGTGFFQRATYKAGFYTGKDYINADGNELKITAFTFGAAFNLRRFRSYDNQYTLINTAFEIGKRGSNKNNITENFFKVSLGLSLSDIWFVKRKYD